MAEIILIFYLFYLSKVRGIDSGWQFIEIFWLLFNCCF